MVGYGSGDAAETIPIRLVEGWEQAAGRINMRGAMADVINLTHDQYLALRSDGPASTPEYTPKDEFIVDRVGSMSEDDFQDTGIEYYRFIN